MIPPLPPPEELAALEAAQSDAPLAYTSALLIESSTESPAETTAETVEEAGNTGEGVGEAVRPVAVKNGDWEAVWSAP